MKKIILISLFLIIFVSACTQNNQAISSWQDAVKVAEKDTRVAAYKCLADNDYNFSNSLFSVMHVVKSKNTINCTVVNQDLFQRLVASNTNHDLVELTENCDENTIGNLTDAVIGVGKYYVTAGSYDEFYFMFFGCFSKNGLEFSFNRLAIDSKTGLVYTLLKASPNS